jgi:two-component system LytT family sensor kinase
MELRFLNKEYYKFSKKEILRHSIIWVIIGAYQWFIDHGTESFWIEISIVYIMIWTYITTFYFLILFVLPRYYKINNLKLFMFWVASYILYESLNHMMYYNIEPLFSDLRTYPDGTPFLSWLLVSSLTYFICASVAFGAYKNRITRLEIESQNEKEKALLLRELGFFKNQFNFHITFSFLNYCYSHMLQFCSKSAYSIELFSQMLRHVMSLKPDEPIALSQELEYIKMFIELHKQLHPEIYVELLFTDNTNDKYILPCLLTTLVENAFKHGIINKEKLPVKIILETTSTLIKFQVSNYKNLQKNVKSTHTGQHNLKMQLELFYRNKHDFIIKTDDEQYICQLQLKV